MGDKGELTLKNVAKIVQDQLSQNTAQITQNTYTTDEN